MKYSDEEFREFVRGLTALDERIKKKRILRDKKLREIVKNIQEEMREVERLPLEPPAKKKSKNYKQSAEKKRRKNKENEMKVTIDKRDDNTSKEVRKRIDVYTSSEEEEIEVAVTDEHLRREHAVRNEDYKIIRKTMVRIGKIHTATTKTTVAVTTKPQKDIYEEEMTENIKTPISLADELSQQRNKRNESRWKKQSETRKRAKIVVGRKWKLNDFFGM
ncbi:PREDICTED: uncharacterized protein LOC106749693 [Dinoponera quadriceps]|uniref:Uncharacterized protein LOC106749693 n=1 Tax=Dinoponera quadriceps TaxID=609295 RepID=A0A6P3Y3Q5_DINQU|nr:PREDICTED: uncharacterized protein LOC106749693 [Dinoponera quadriceps]XP_014484868.1 PREDICTED: uncharacterized protein LOC106749693 [Dinoponera quadriceps]XP_014484869.1 PREDICTED: uncharacterized protein LOC106749693 [Dinoponera quadriceps]XP_014484871.1 PREDICTED: uncharacterized protein LOC106749693 [Dinoponera quadriceps]